MKNILVLIDGSEPSLRAIQYALTLAQRVEDATVHVVNIQVPITPGRAARFFSQEVLEDYYSEEGHHVMAKANEILADAPVKVIKKVIVGKLEDSVRDYIEDHECSHAVMGTRGLSAVPGIFLGSVTTRMIQAVDIPLTLVK
ncbi:MAG TPA: universal stress protein [Paenalcaligenes sp.]|nr:universal stress protein [Paenalcaligenes sp.]